MSPVSWFVITVVVCGAACAYDLIRGKKIFADNDPMRERLTRTRDQNLDPVYRELRDINDKLGGRR